MEICILVQLLKGAHAGGIAKELQIKQTTAESYLVNIKNKLAVNSKSALINAVINGKLLEQIIVWFIFLVVIVIWPIIDFNV